MVPKEDRVATLPDVSDRALIFIKHQQYTYRLTYTPEGIA